MDKLKKRERNFLIILIDAALLGIIILIFAPYAISLLFRITPFFIVSDSMSHVKRENETFWQFWQNQGFSPEETRRFPFLNGLEVGDVVLIKRSAPFKPGDVIAHKRSTLTDAKKVEVIVVHRVVWVDKSRLATIADRLINSYTVSKIEPFLKVGDQLTFIKKSALESLKEKNNLVYLPLIDTYKETVLRSQYVGKAIFKIPKIGYFYVLVQCAVNKNCSFNQCLFRNECNLRKENTNRQ